MLIYLAPISLYYKQSFIYDLLFIHPEATISVVEKITDPLGFRKNSCNEHLGKIPKKPTHFGVLNSSTFAGLLGVRKTSRLERFMYVLDVKRKACLGNFRHVQRCAYPELLIRSFLIRHMCSSLKKWQIYKGLHQISKAVNKLIKRIACIFFFSPSNRKTYESN